MLRTRMKFKEFSVNINMPYAEKKIFIEISVHI